MDGNNSKFICVEIEHTFSEDHYVKADTYEKAKEIAMCRGIPQTSDCLHWLETVPVEEWDEKYYVKKGDEYVEIDSNSS